MEPKMDIDFNVFDEEELETITIKKEKEPAHSRAFLIKS